MTQSTLFKPREQRKLLSHGRAIRTTTDSRVESRDDRNDPMAPPTDAMQAVTVTQVLTEHRPNAQHTKECADRRLVLGLLVNEVVERLQGALQAVLTDFESVLRHFVRTDLDQPVYS